MPLFIQQSTNQIGDAELIDQLPQLGINNNYNDVLAAPNNNIQIDESIGSKNKNAILVNLSTGLTAYGEVIVRWIVSDKSEIIDHFF